MTCVTFVNLHDCSKKKKRDPIIKVYGRKRVYPWNKLTLKEFRFKRAPLPMNICKGNTIQIRIWIARIHTHYRFRDCYFPTCQSLGANNKLTGSISFLFGVSRNQESSDGLERLRLETIDFRLKQFFHSCFTQFVELFLNCRPIPVDGRKFMCLEFRLGKILSA